MIKTPTKTRQSRSGLMVWPSLFALTAGMPFAAGEARADPILPSGNANESNVTITSNGTDTVTASQSASRAFVSWDDFSVGAGGTFQVNYDMSGGSFAAAQAILVNRVTGSGASMIDGTISALGHVWILNGNGIVFGAGSQVNVGGFLGSTLTSIDGHDDPTTQGTYFVGNGFDLSAFRLSGSGGSITTSGPDSGNALAAASLTSNKGPVILLAPTVSNSGSINASSANNNGAAALIAATDVSLGIDLDANTGLLLSGVVINAGSTATGTAVSAGGAITGNRVILAAARATPGASANALIDVSGTVIANAATVNGGGDIVLYAAEATDGSMNSMRQTVLASGAVGIVAAASTGADISVSTGGSLDAIATGGSVKATAGGDISVGAAQAFSGSGTLDARGAVSVTADVTAANDLTVNGTTGVTVASSKKLQSNADASGGGLLSVSSSDGTVQASGASLLGGGVGEYSTVSIDAGAGAALGTVEGGVVGVTNGGARVDATGDTTS